MRTRVLSPGQQWAAALSHHRVVNRSRVQTPMAAALRGVNLQTAKPSGDERRLSADA
jgi:hypothetical protein